LGFLAKNLGGACRKQGARARIALKLAIVYRE